MLGVLWPLKTFGFCPLGLDMIAKLGKIAPKSRLGCPCMLGRKFFGAMVTACAIFLGPSALAQNAGPPAATGSTGGVKIWFDGAYHSVNLPTFALGFFNLGVGTFEPLGATQTYKPRAAGEGVSGGISFLLSHGVLPGTNARVALVGAFADVTSTQTGSALSEFNVAQLLGGQLSFPCGPCVLPSRLETEHRQWRAGLATSSEFSAGALIFIPSFEFFGGGARTSQIYAQQRIAGLAVSYYDSLTALQSRDIGAKIGLAVVMPVAPMIELGVSGTLATAYRHVNFAGNDRFDDGISTLTSAIDVSRSVVAFIPGAHAQLTVRPAPSVQLKAFGGVELDTRVPGIISPQFTAEQFLALVGTTTPATPASISFSSQTNYFFGGGISVAFTP